MARFETDRYGDQAYIIFSERDGIADASYSYVDPSLRGKGVGYFLVKEWATLMESKSLKTTGSCGFVQRSLDLIEKDAR